MGLVYLEPQRCPSLGQLLTSKDSSLGNKQAFPKNCFQWQGAGQCSPVGEQRPKGHDSNEQTWGFLVRDSVFLGLGIPGCKMNAAELACSVVEVSN